MAYTIKDDETYRFGELKPDREAAQAQFADSWKGNKFVVISGAAIRNADRKIKTFEDLVRMNPVAPDGGSLFRPGQNYTFLLQTVDDGKMELKELETWTAHAPALQQGVGDRVEVIEDGYAFNANNPKDKQRLARISVENKTLKDEMQAYRADDQAFKTQLLQTVQKKDETITGLMDRMLEEREARVRHEVESQRNLADRDRAERDAKEAREERDRAAEDGRLQGLADAEASKTFGLANEVMTAGITTFGPGLMSLIERIAKKFLDDETPPGAQTAMANDPPPPTTMPGFPAAPGASQTMKAMNNGNYVQV